MRLFLLFTATGALTILFQTTFLHLLPLGIMAPDLVLVLCVYLGLNHHTWGAVLGVFFLGYSVDLFSSPVIGIHAFALSFVFLAVYVSSHWIWIQSPFLSAAVVFLASWLKGGALILLWTFFSAQSGIELAGFLKYTLSDSLAAALFAPPVFYGLSRARNFLEGSRIAV